jgi:T5SS/PEP-CTERM-associated repeat protein
MPVYDRFDSLHWRAGRNSCYFGMDHLGEWDAGLDNAKHTLEITGNGGGRFYFYTEQCVGNNTHPDHREVYVEGTREPLWFYGLNSEISKVISKPELCDANVEIVNGQNISILGVKREGVSPSIIMRDCRNIAVYSSGAMREEMFAGSGGYLQILGTSDNILIANALVQTVLSMTNSEALVRESLTGQPTNQIMWPDGVSLYKRGEFNSLLLYGAVTNNFNNGGGNWLWTNAVNWDMNALPGTKDLAKSGLAGTVTLNASATIGSLLWGSDGTSVVDVVTGGNLISGNLLIGNYSATATGELRVNGGTVSGRGLLRLGVTAGNTGKFVLNSGSVTIAPSITSVGYSGTGCFDMTGGDFRGQSIYIAHLAGSSGTMTVSGGTLDLSSTLTVGNLDNGQLTVTGGALSTKSFGIGGGANNTTSCAALLGGSLTVTGGMFTVSANSELHIEDGTFIQAGNAISTLGTYIADGLVTWVNGRSMLGTYTASWTNGSSVLYADYDNINPGKTTVWATHRAVTNSFNNGGGDWLWTNSANWDQGALPRVEDLAKSGLAGTVTLNASATIGSLLWGSDGTSVVDVVTGGNLISGNLLIGNYSATATGELRVNGGTVVGTSLLRLGVTAGNTGKFVLNSGSVSIASSTTSVGYQGTGYFDMTGGDFRGFILNIADQTGSLGTMTVSGGALDLSSAFMVGNKGNGQLTVNGGALSSKSFGVGGGVNNTTSYAALLGGSVTATGGMFTVTSNSELHIEGGTFIQAGNAISTLSSYITAGLITWANGQTMLATNYNASWTNGTSILYADYNNLNYGKTTVWATDDGVGDRIAEASENVTSAVSVQHTSGGLTFESVPEGIYSVEACNDLLNGNWEVLTNEWVGTGDILEYKDMGTEARRFYRVKVRLP